MMSLPISTTAVVLWAGSTGHAEAEISQCLLEVEAQDTVGAHTGYPITQIILIKTSKGAEMSQRKILSLPTLSSFRNG